MAPRTAKAKKNAEVKISENEAPKKGRGKAKILPEPDLKNDEIVEEKAPVSEKKAKRGKNVVNENEQTNKEEAAPPAKKGRKKNNEEPVTEVAINGDNSAEEDSNPADENGELTEANGDSEDTQKITTKGRKKNTKKESAEKEVKSTGRGKKNVKPENNSETNKEEVAEEKPKGRGRGRKAQPKSEAESEEPKMEDEPKVDATAVKGKKKGQKVAQENPSDNQDEVQEQQDDNVSEDLQDENKDVETEKNEEEPKKKENKGRKNAGKKAAATKDAPEDKEDDVKEDATAGKKKRGGKKEDKGKGDAKEEPTNEEPKPAKAKRGQKKAAEKQAESEEVQDTGEPTTKRRRKDDKANEDSKKKVIKSATDYESIDFSNTSKNAQGKEWNFKISCWNVDGIRAWMGKGGLDYLKFEKPDILCLQEVKCSMDKLPEEIKNLPGYHAYWLCSDKDGYAGVGVYTTKLAMNVQYGLQNEELDSDGRIITAEYEQFYLICTYVPNAGRKLVTLPKRLKWNEEFRRHVKSLDKKKPVIICGDMNVAHNEIDLTNPKSNKKNAGFTEEERAGMTQLLGDGFVDTYRHYYPERTGAYTFWSNMFNSRAKNVGWRLDYFIVSERLVPALCDSVIRDKVYGSDHCPISLVLHLSSADKPKEQ